MAKTTNKGPAPTTAVAKQQAKDVAAPGTDAELLAEIAGDTGAGFEEAGKDAYAIPFITVLQDLSPQVKPKMAGYVQGAKPGMFFHTVSQELFTEVTLVPCYYSQVHIEWIPRDKGGGFVAAHPANTPLVRTTIRDGGKNILPNGHELMDTRQHFVLLVRPDGSMDEALVALKSTQLKYSRRWMSNQRAAVIEVDGKLITPPAFAWAYTFGVVEEANDEGSWWSWDLKGRERVTDATVYRRAKAFNATMKQGAVKVNYDELQTQGASSAEARDPGAGPGADNEIGDM